MSQATVDWKPVDAPTGPARTPDKATAALILGIVSFLLPFAGPITASLAWVFGNQALETIKADPQRWTGEGTAKAGKILGIVYWCLAAGTVVLAALVFVVVANLPTGQNGTSPPLGLPWP